MNQDVTNRLLSDQRAITRAIVQEELRAKTGVQPGGPYGLFSVDAQGRLTWASRAQLVVADVTSLQSITTSPQRVPFDTVQVDPLNGVTTGASWQYAIPLLGWYRAYIRMEVDKKNDVCDRGEVWQANVYDSSLGSLVGTMQQQHFFVAVTSATISGFKLIGHLDFQITSLPYAIAITLDRNTTSHNRDVTGGRLSIDYLGP